jgi:hypothetical protein
MASTISALTSGGGGISMTGDASGILNLNSNGTTVVAVTRASVAVTGTLAATGAVTLTSTLGVTGAITGSSTVAGSTGILYPLTSGTAVATTSGTSVDFTSIPSWVKRITVMLNGVSLSGTSSILIQGGNSGGVVSTGYVSTTNVLGQASNSGGLNSTAGFSFYTDAAASLSSGIITLINSSGSTWVSSHTGKNSTVLVVIGGGNGTIATLDRIRLTTVNGTDTFDAGSVNILYE